MINKNGLQQLIEQKMFHLIDVYGLDLPYDEVVQHLKEDDIIVEDEQMLKDAYDFVNDQSGINYLASPVTQDVLKIVNGLTNNYEPTMNKSATSISNDVRQYLELQGQVDERTADSVAMAVKSILIDLQDGTNRYK